MKYNDHPVTRYIEYSVESFRAFISTFFTWCSVDVIYITVPGV